MPAPNVHDLCCVKKWGGKPDDYAKINALMDNSKCAVPDNRHRVVWHNSYACTVILPLIFGDEIVNSDGRHIPVKDIGEYHCLCDFGGKFVPSLQDYVENMSSASWINNGHGLPSSAKRLKLGKPTQIDVSKITDMGELIEGTYSTLELIAAVEECVVPVDKVKYNPVTGEFYIINSHGKTSLGQLANDGRLTLCTKVSKMILEQITEIMVDIEMFNNAVKIATEKQ